MKSELPRGYKLVAGTEWRGPYLKSAAETCEIAIDPDDDIAIEFDYERNYTFIPTVAIVELLRANGYTVTKGAEPTAAEWELLNEFTLNDAPGGWPVNWDETLAPAVNGDTIRVQIRRAKEGDQGE